MKQLHTASSKSYTQQVSKCRGKSKKGKQVLQKGKEKAIKLHDQEASKEEAEEEEEEAITCSKPYTQQMSKRRRKRIALASFNKGQGESNQAARAGSK